MKNLLENLSKKELKFLKTFAPELVKKQKKENKEEKDKIFNHFKKEFRILKRDSLDTCSMLGLTFEMGIHFVSFYLDDPFQYALFYNGKDKTSSNMTPINKVIKNKKNLLSLLKELFPEEMSTFENKA